MPNKSQEKTRDRGKMLMIAANHLKISREIHRI
jgi:hypothetical protein